jgi:hypothetical protein
MGSYTRARGYYDQRVIDRASLEATLIRDTEFDKTIRALSARKIDVPGAVQRLRDAYHAAEVHARSVVQGVSR